MAPPGRFRLGRYTSTHAVAVRTEKIPRTGERTVRRQVSRWTRGSDMFNFGKEMVGD